VTKVTASGTGETVRRNAAGEIPAQLPLNVRRHCDAIRIALARLAQPGRQVPTAGRQRLIAHFYGHDDNLQALLPYLKQEVLETRNLLLSRLVKR
jgi:hypothetical protein